LTVDSAEVTPEKPLESSKAGRFIASVQNSNTRRSYAVSLGLFFRHILQVPADKDPSIDELCDQYFGFQRDYGKDLEEFVSWMVGQDYAPGSISVRRKVVQAFFSYSDISLTDGTKYRLRHMMPKVVARTLNEVPTMEMLARVLPILTLEARTFFLMMISTGGRMFEIFNLAEGDINLHVTPPVVYFKVTKGGAPRYSFLNHEASASLATWLQGSAGHGDRLWLSSRERLEDAWGDGLAVCGLDKRDPQTHRLIFHPHTLRKYFRTHLREGLDRDYIEALMGHKKEMDSIYAVYVPDQLGRLYAKAESYLYVLS